MVHNSSWVMQRALKYGCDNTAHAHWYAVPAPVPMEGKRDERDEQSERDERGDEETRKLQIRKLVWNHTASWRRTIPECRGVPLIDVLEAQRYRCSATGCPLSTDEAKAPQHPRLTVRKGRVQFVCRMFHEFARVYNKPEQLRVLRHCMYLWKGDKTSDVYRRRWRHMSRRYEVSGPRGAKNPLDSLWNNHIYKVLTCPPFGEASKRKARTTTGYPRNWYTTRQKDFYVAGAPGCRGVSTHNSMEHVYRESARRCRGCCAATGVPMNGCHYNPAMACIVQEHPRRVFASFYGILLVRFSPEEHGESIHTVAQCWCDKIEARINRCRSRESISEPRKKVRRVSNN